MSIDAAPSRTAEQFIVRFPDGMRGRIADAAKAAGRSMNAEIVARLQRTFAEDEHNAWAMTAAKLDVGQLADAIAQRLTVLAVHSRDSVGQPAASGVVPALDETAPAAAPESPVVPAKRRMRLGQGKAPK